MDLKPVKDYMARISRLPPVELIWLLGWNVAAGEWKRIGLDPPAAKEFLIDLFGRVQGDLTNLSKRSAAQLQQAMMAIRCGSFEEIQQEPPFSPLAQRNLDGLLQAWSNRGQAGFAEAWDNIFHSGREVEWATQNPIQIVGENGDCEERALKVVGANDQEGAVAAEWWYLYYTFGKDWKWEGHATVDRDGTATFFSVHSIQISPNARRQIYFIVPS